MRTRISPALVIACVALIVALGGASFAAVTLPRSSVGTKQLKRNAVTGPKVKNKSLTVLDINQGSLGFGRSLSIAAAELYPGAATACLGKDPSSSWRGQQLRLPQGARITKVTGYVLDNSAGAITVKVTRYTHGISGAVNLGSTATTVNSPNLQDVVVAGSPLTVVDNANYAYLLHIELPDVGHATCGASVDYTLP
jgi:hypothetical protein